VLDDTGEPLPVLTHRSNPLSVVMRRFNVYSNNDIVRVADGLGTVEDLENFVNRRLGIRSGGVELETASGERRNRMTVEHMVALLTELEVEGESQDLDLRQLLPVIGCDPGSTRRMFPALAGPELSGSVTCKTGTLTHTDGGVAVLAGTFTSAAKGPVVFAVAAPRAGGSLQYWRRAQQRWILQLIEKLDGAIRRPCGPPLPFSEADAEIEVVGLAAE
jgi:D-alanyl-D-alanine carboxypeptidase